ncbi:MAG: SpoIID/LytB domain-containing protein [Bacteroidetes bacterium]|nr:SpoIID/LytB domain-containing protein [Bacteroidota bacterium]
MKSRVILILFCILLQSQVGKSNYLYIRLYADIPLTYLQLYPAQGTYILSGDGKIINSFSNGNFIEIATKGDSLVLKREGIVFGVYKSLLYSGETSLRTFKIKPLEPFNSATRNYHDNLEIRSVNGLLRLLNIVDIENYIGGVVESEGGGKAAVEYYKLQAILCRTYTLAHLRRHELEGFQLCDQVHCQAYKSRTLKKEIIDAVEGTKGLVVVDSDLSLITAAYHSNCGGETVNSEDIWSLPKSYLRSRKDSFCLAQTQANWVKKTTAQKWNNYVFSKVNSLPTDCTMVRTYSPIYSQEETRKTYYTVDSTRRIPLRVIRDDWQLKSTYFSVEQNGDEIILKGKGFGHGVGLCQQGAMEMAKKNYSYKEIIHYYYKDVHIVDLSILDFFRQE